MIIESILSKIELFKELVIESGFKRDIEDYLQSIQQTQNRNLVFLKDLSIKLRDAVIGIENRSLNSELEIVLKSNKPFTNINIIERIQDMIDDNEINSDQYYDKFNSLLNEIANSIELNEQELISVKTVFIRYIPDSSNTEAGNEQAIISLIFKDLKSTGTIKEFAKVLQRWNKTIHIYYTILKSESPEEFELLEIQNGSIDVLFNIDLDIAIDLTELMKTGLKVYGAYLLYKSTVGKTLVDFYFGNEKLIKSEQEREKLLLDNIKDSLKLKIIEQHEFNVLNDDNIDKNIDKKVDEVVKVIADHIIKGNEIRLISTPKEKHDDKDLSRELREETAIVRERYKALKQSDRQLLIDKYSIRDEE